MTRTLRSLFLLFLLFSAPHGLFAATWTDGSPIQANQGLNPVADWSTTPPRHWPGPSMWCNRLQDWRVKDGYLRAEAQGNTPCRTAHLLTYQLVEKAKPFYLSVRVNQENSKTSKGFVGFLIGAGEGRLNYRGASLIHHYPGKGGGILAVLETNNRDLTFRDMSAETNKAVYPKISHQKTVMQCAIAAQREIVLFLEGLPTDSSTYKLHLSAWSADKQELLGAAELGDVPSAKLLGNIALVSHAARTGAVHMFRNFQVGGGRLDHVPDHAFGPMAGTLYSISHGVLKLSAQFMHLGEETYITLPTDTQNTNKKVRLQARLEIKNPHGQWGQVGEPQAVVGPDFYVLFRVEDWDTTRAADTRVVFQDYDGMVYYYQTHIKQEPVARATLSIAGFTGMGAIGRSPYSSTPSPKKDEVVIGRWTPANVWSPFNKEVHALQNQNLDLLFFTGDQVYETKPSPKDWSIDPTKDYLYKWLIWHWAFHDLTRELPAIVQPDDHDIYHGNLWGWGGRLNLTGHNNGGGYLRAPHFVNIVHRTQSGHLPDAYDPKPVLNGISNYYTKFNWGGVGFAVLADRQYKTPRHVDDPSQQVLLGEQQKRMLREWGQDWRGQQFKCVVSQTIYASMHVGFDGSISRDADSNGFPKARRDEVVDLFRRCGAFVLSGDQHLSTFARLGIDRPCDAVYQFAVPAMGNYFWRWFYPREPGANRQAGAPDYTGNFQDGFNNHFRMIAVANPARRTLMKQRLRQRHIIPKQEATGGFGDERRVCQGDGYGIVRFHKNTHKITVECWPYDANPQKPEEQFEGWPLTLEFAELDGREPKAWLPDLEMKGPVGAALQIIDQQTNEVIQSTRIWQKTYSPGVFRIDGAYTLKVGHPKTGQWWIKKDIQPNSTPGLEKFLVDWQ